jgi:hypothetical protein
MKNDHSCDVADVVEHEFRVCSPIETGPVPPTATRRARTRQASHSPPRGPGAGLAGAVPLSADTSPAGRPSGTEDGDGCVPSLEKGATAAPLSRTSRGKGEVTGPAPGPPVSAPQAVSSEAAGGKPSSQEAASIQGRALRALQAAAAAGASTEAGGPGKPPRAVVTALEAVEDSINSFAELDDLIVFLSGRLAAAAAGPSPAAAEAERDAAPLPCGAAPLCGPREVPRPLPPLPDGCGWCFQVLTDDRFRCGWPACGVQAHRDCLQPHYECWHRGMPIPPTAPGAGPPLGPVTQGDDEASRGSAPRGRTGNSNRHGPPSDALGIDARLDAALRRDKALTGRHTAGGAQLRQASNERARALWQRRGTVRIRLDLQQAFARHAASPQAEAVPPGAKAHAALGGVAKVQIAAAPEVAGAFPPPWTSQASAPLGDAARRAQQDTGSGGPAGARALEQCNELCWCCVEHDDVLEQCSFAHAVPHREHLCLECRALLAAPWRGGRSRDAEEPCGEDPGSRGHCGAAASRSS